MRIICPAPNPDYQLLDTGAGRKLERFGGYTVDRPEPQAIWARSQPAKSWAGADAVFEQQGKWRIVSQPPRPWLFKWKGLALHLKLAPYKHTGIFPEQQANWEWLVKLIGSWPEKLKVLNLFAYTGGATLACARAGAEVCHVDSSNPAIAWARDSQRQSGLEDRPIRWILDDCIKFVTREAKRRALYDAVVMDPPAFGRDHRGNVFKFERDLPKLLALCRQLLPERPRFFLINSYNIGLPASVLLNLLNDAFPHEAIEFGELHLQETSGRSLSCSSYARFPPLT